MTNRIPFFLLFFQLSIAASLYSIAPLEHFEFPKYLLTLVISILLLGYWAYNWLIEAKPLELKKEWSAWLETDLLSLGVLVFLASSVLSTIFSISPNMSFYGNITSVAGLPLMLAFAIFYFSTRALVRKQSRPHNLTALLSFALITCAVACWYMLVQFTQNDPLGWIGVLRSRDVFRPIGTLGHPNFMSAYLVITLPVLIYFTVQAVKERRLGALIFLLLLNIISLVSIFIAQSRGSWLALFGTLAFLVWAYSSKAQNKWTAALKTFFWLAGLLVLSCGLGYLVALKWYPQFLAEFRERVIHILELGPARQEYWVAAFRIFKKYPILGSGLDTFQLAFQHQRNAQYWLDEWAGAPHRAHNDFLNIAATQGSLGIFSAILILIGLGQAVMRALRKHSENRWLVLTLTAMVVGYLLQGISSFTVSTNGILFALAAGALSGLSQRSLERQVDGAVVSVEYALTLAVCSLITLAVFFNNFLPIEGREFWLLLSLLAILVWASFSALSLVFRDQDQAWFASKSFRTLALALGLGVLIFAGPVRWFESSVIAKKAADMAETDVRQSIMFFEKAIVMNRADENFVEKVAVTAEKLLANAKTDREKDEINNFQIRAYDKATRINPAQANYWYSLGITLSYYASRDLARITEKERSFQALRKAIELEPANPIFLFGLISTSILFGDLTTATTYLGQAKRFYPDHSVTYYHQGYVDMGYGRYAEAVLNFDHALTGRLFDKSARSETEFRETDRDKAKNNIEFAKAKIIDQMKSVSAVQK